MSKNITSMSLWMLAGIALVGVITLIGINRPIPTELWAILSVLVGAAAGVTMPTVTLAAAAESTAPGAVAAPVAPVAVPVAPVAAPVAPVAAVVPPA
jgi:hypothetical protein